MSEIRSVAYLSSTHSTLTDADLENLLNDARAFNQTVGVTGALLYNGAAFFQYLEGDVVACGTVLERIHRSSRHHSVHVLADRLVPSRHFANWTMAFSQASQSQLLALAQAQWNASTVHGAGVQGQLHGITLLKAFWQSATGVY